MFLFKNSVINIKRNIKKYMIFMFVVFLISFISFTSIILITSANSYLTIQKQEYGSIVSISRTDDSFSEMQPGGPGEESDAQSVDTLTDEDYTTFADSEYVDSLLVESTVGVDYDDSIELVGQEELEELQAERESEMEGDESQNNEVMAEGDQAAGGNAQGGFTQAGASLIAYSDYSNLDYFLDDSISITAGTIPEGDDEILISSQLAELNDLEVGDSMSVTSLSETSVDYIISGIYYSEDDTENVFSTSTVPSNTSYVSTASLEQFDSGEFGPMGTTSEYLYKLNSYEDFDAFSQELVDEGLSEDYELSYPSDDLSSVVTPLENMLDVVQIYLISTFIIGGLILIFIVQLNLKGRKFEIGILRALNYDRGKLVLSFVVELVVSSLIAAAVSLIFVFIFTAPIAENFINSQLSETQTEEQGRGQTQPGGFNVVNEETDTLDASDIEIDYSPVVVFYSILLIEGLVIFSSIYGLSFVYRSNPNKILRERA